MGIFYDQETIEEKVVVQEADLLGRGKNILKYKDIKIPDKDLYEIRGIAIKLSLEIPELKKKVYMDKKAMRDYPNIYICSFSDPDNFRSPKVLEDLKQFIRGMKIYPKLGADIIRNRDKIKSLNDVNKLTIKAYIDAMVGAYKNSRKINLITKEVKKDDVLSKYKLLHVNSPYNGGLMYNHYCIIAIPEDKYK